MATTARLKKTPECFAQLAQGLKKVELHWDSRRYESDGAVGVPLSYHGQPLLLCFPPQQRHRRSEDFSMALAVAEPEDTGGDLVRSLRGLDRTIKAFVDGTPELAARAAQGGPSMQFKGLLRGEPDAPHVVLHWARGEATLTTKHGALLEAEELVRGEAEPTAVVEVRAVAARLTVSRDGEAKVQCRATEIRRIRLWPTPANGEGGARRRMHSTSSAWGAFFANRPGKRASVVKTPAADAGVADARGGCCRGGLWPEERRPPPAPPAQPLRSPYGGPPGYTLRALLRGCCVCHDENGYT